MRMIDKIYIGGEFVVPHGEELYDLFNPVLGTVFGRVRLGDVEDTRRAIATAKRAFPSFSRTPKSERLAMLRSLHDAVAGAQQYLIVRANVHAAQRAAALLRRRLAHHALTAGLGIEDDQLRSAHEEHASAVRQPLGG